MNTLDFEKSLVILEKIEGGVSDLKGDAGKLTFRGVTQASYDNFREIKGLGHQLVTAMDDEEHREIYENYWNAGYCDRMTWPLNIVHFLLFVNANPPNAYKVLQRALGITPDGIIGKQSLAAIDLAKGSQAIIIAYRYLLYQTFYYDTLDEGPDKERNIANTRFLTVLWLKRIKMTFEAIDALDIHGSIPTR